MCLIFHIVENKASILFFFPSQPERGFLNVFLHKSSKKPALCFQMQVPTTAPVAPGGKPKGLQVGSFKMTQSSLAIGLTDFSGKR